MDGAMDQRFDGPLGDGEWHVICERGEVEVWAVDRDDNSCLVLQTAQHLRDFARSLERAADYLEAARREVK
jgi:hypothetical protein